MDDFVLHLSRAINCVPDLNNDKRGVFRHNSNPCSNMGIIAYYGIKQFLYQYSYSSKNLSDILG